MPLVSEAMETPKVNWTELANLEQKHKQIM